MLLTIYKSFVCLQLDYGDIVSDQAYNDSSYLCVAYNAALKIIRAFKTLSREKLGILRIQELSLETLRKHAGYADCVFSMDTFFLLYIF